MALTQPSYEFGGAVPTVWGQEITANIPQLVDGIVELGKRARPTTSWLWNQKKYVGIGVDGTFHQDISYGGHDVEYTTTGLTTFGGSTASAFDTSASGGLTNDKSHVLGREHLTRLTITPAVCMVKSWITDFDRKRYDGSLMDLVEEKTFRMHNGFTHVMDYEVWAVQGEGSESSNTSAVIGVDGFYGANITDSSLTLNATVNAPTTVAGRLWSLPSLIKVPGVDMNIYDNATAAGKEFAQIHGLSTVNADDSLNKAWAPHIYAAKGSAGGVPQELNDGTAAANRNGEIGALASGGVYSADSLTINDFCITITSTMVGDPAELTEGAIPENLGSLKRDFPITVANASYTAGVKDTAAMSNPTLADIDFMLEQMQIGNGLEIMVACSPAAYNYIARDFFGATLGYTPSTTANTNVAARTMGGPLNDYGMNFGAQHFRHSGYNAIFYADPSMSGTWDHSLWFYDMEAIEWVCVEDFGPKIYPWQRIPYSTVDGMAKIMWCQRMNKNPVATGVLLGCNWR